MRSLNDARRMRKERCGDTGFGRADTVGVVTGWGGLVSVGYLCLEEATKVAEQMERELEKVRRSEGLGQEVQLIPEMGNEEHR